jgi:hypothetical protein
MTKATLERFHGDTRAVGAKRLNLDGSGPQEFGC